MLARNTFPIAAETISPTDGRPVLLDERKWFEANWDDVVGMFSRQSELINSLRKIPDYVCPNKVGWTAFQTRRDTAIEVDSEEDEVKYGTLPPYSGGVKQMVKA